VGYGVEIMVGKIECRTSPEINASIYYDGRKQTNTTPIRLTGVPAGSHTIKFELDGYESQTKTVNVSNDTTSYSTVTLKSIVPPAEEKGKIRCVTTPSGADVYFNERKQVNKTPVTLTGVTPNKFHTIKFTKSDFLDSSDQWLVKPGQTIVAEKILTPVMQPGYINAISDLPDVTVKMIIEGKSYSYPAPHKFGASAGRQVVFFSKPAHKQVEHSITVEPRQTVTLKGNPIPIVADTTLILNTLPSEVSEGDKITLSGTLQSKDGKPVVGQIHFYDKDTATADDELFESNKPLVAMSSSSTGKYSATWTAKKVDSESLIERGTSGAQIYAAFDGTQTHNKSKSMIRNITLKEIAKEGQLRITTRPPGADVYIDGEKQEIGTSAEEFSVIKKLPFGKYVVKTEIKGFDPMEEEVEIKEGPYETIVNHIYEGAKNLCGVLGLETTELGCVRAILTLPVDLFTPLADAHVIKYHKSMYTGKPEIPTNMTYAFFLLGCIPVAGPLGKIVSKAGFKITAKGAQLAQLAKADPRIASIFMEENIVHKILSMTATEVDKFIDLVVKKNYDGIRAMLKDTKAEALPTDKLDEIITNAKTIIPDEDALKRMEDILTIEKAVPDKFMFWTDWLKSILKADKTSVSHDEAVKILKDAMDDPSLFRKIADELDLSGITARLENINTDESVSVYSLVRWISKIDTRLPIEQQNKLVAEMAETALATLENTPKFVKELPKALDEIEDISSRVYPFTSSVRAAGLDEPFNLVDEMTVFLRSIKTTPFTSRPKATAAFISKIMTGMKEFMQANPKFAMKTLAGVTIMSLWFWSDNVPFYFSMLLKAFGLGPSTKSFDAKDRIKTLSDMKWELKNACDTGDFDQLKLRLATYLETIESLETHVESNRSTLEREGTLENIEDRIEEFHMIYGDMLGCLPAEIEIPGSGLISDVTVKEIVDGDTIKCRIADQPEFDVRMAGYNTPEKKPAILDFYPVTCTKSVGSEPHTIECSKEIYQEANGFFWKLIESKTVSLKINPDRPKDAYGRYIAVVVLENSSEANLEMIKAGHACFYHEEYFGKPIIYDPDAYIAARDEAKAAGLGIWASTELEADVGTVYFKAYRYTEEEKLTPKSVEVWSAATEETAESFICMTSTDEVTLTTGDYNVVFKSMGFENQTKSFTLEKNATLIIEVTMKEITDEEKEKAEELEGYLLIKSYRISSEGNYVYAASDVFEKDVYLFRTSESTLQAIPPGEHTITLKRLNYEDKTESFTIHTGENTIVNSTLVELDETEDPDTPDGPIGLVDFMTTPSVAKIFVDGLYIGTTKKSGFECVGGTYTVSLEKSGYDACIKSITVIADERVPVECILTESLLPPTEGEYPEVPYFPTSPSRTRLPPSTYEITPVPALPPTAPEPEAEPWEKFKAPMKVLFLNVGKEVTKQTSITTAGQKFMDKHCDLEFEWESEDHDTVELGVDDDDCATLDDIEELTEVIEPDKVPEGTKIIYLLWNADEPKCVSYTGFTSGMDDLLFDAILCSSPTSKSDPVFTATTGKLKNDNLDIKYEGSLTIIIQICEALHELYEKTKPDDAEELPEFDDELCKKDITDDRPNAKCVVEWLSKFNDALPDEVKK
jgi:endonuclease YncB( thermonuclease family)